MYFKLKVINEVELTYADEKKLTTRVLAIEKAVHKHVDEIHSMAIFTNILRVAICTKV